MLTIAEAMKSPQNIGFITAVYPGMSYKLFAFDQYNISPNATYKIGQG